MPEPFSMTLRLHPSATAARSARQSLRSACRNAPGELLHDAMLLISEVVTNAVSFARSIITVAIECDGSTVAVAIIDDNPNPPQLAEPADDSEHGRGLHLVDRIADSWGWRATPHGDGKVVWFKLGIA